MEIFIAAVIIMSSVSVATFQIVRNIRYRELADSRQRVSTMLLYACAVLLVFNMLAGGQQMVLGFVFDVLLTAIPLSMFCSSFWGWSAGRKASLAVLCVQFMMVFYYVLVLCGQLESPSRKAMSGMVVAVTVVYVSVFLLGIWFRVREVREVLHSNTVWSCLNLSVDAVYMIVILLEVSALLAAESLGGCRVVDCMVALLLGGAMSGYGLRIASDSLFVLMRRHERTIIESMKISPIEVTGNGVREDDVYRDVYERIVEYFESEKPFLNGDLTINDVVAVVFSNKLYISRAISQHTGRNFCQFVNYYRVRYSVDCYRKNPGLKVTDLWQMCGFNTIVSYNMAFRLFMGENPSDWCKKEKQRLFRRKK